MKEGREGEGRKAGQKGGQEEGGADHNGHWGLANCIPS